MPSNYLHGAPMIKRHYLDVASGQLHYRSCGDAAKPPLVLLHQSPSSSVMYEVLMAELAHEYYVLAPDSPGFGQSDALVDGFTVASVAAIIAEFLTSVVARPCYLFGHHTGAAVATQVVADFPGLVVSLALSGPTLLSFELQKILPSKATNISLEADGRHLLSMWQRIAAKDDQAPLELIQREVLLAWACGAAYGESYGDVSAIDYAQLLQRTTCETLVFAGDQDPLFGGLDDAVAYLPKGRKVSGPKAGRTYACERQSEDVARILSNFFKQ